MIDNSIPKKIKQMTVAQLEELCDELRAKIKETVMRNGGHLSSNLGMVELTVALHYVFDFPTDKIIFDVGHQCYPHKLISGRAEEFDTLRKKGGISGFPKREESDYDCYNTGHAGTSVSAAIGFAKARDIKKENYAVIAVIGDGSFNNGLVYEAFNSLKPLNTNILVILNDNGMSISPTVGSMHEYLEILSEDSAHRRKKENHAEIFKRFGFSYDGVYDGNNLTVMIEKLTEIKEKLKTGSVILHILTKKGKGYSFCEEDPQSTHGISLGANRRTVEYSQIFGQTLCRMAENRPEIVAVTAAMTPSLGLGEFFEKYPERSMDVGICEEHATILAAALAAQGLKPYYAVYSTFLQRSFDEIMIDICSQNLPVTLCVDRAGISGNDGETHQGVFDLSFLSMIPNLTVAVPKDTEEFRRILEFSADFPSPLAVRYPREGKTLFPVHTPIEAGKWEKLLGDNRGEVTIVACGERAITKAWHICEVLREKNVAADLVNARFVKPLDCEMLDGIASGIIVTLEDNMLLGGLGALIDVYFSQTEKKIKNFAYCDRFIPHGGVDELMDDYGMNEEEIIAYILKQVGEKSR